MSEHFQGGIEDPEKLLRIKQSLEAERAPLTELYTRFLNGQLGRDERIQLRVDIAQHIKELRGMVWDKQEVPLLSDTVDKNSLEIADLFGMLVQLEDHVAALRVKTNTTS